MKERATVVHLFYRQDIRAYDYRYHKCDSRCGGIVGFNFPAMQNEVDGRSGKKLKVIEEELGRYIQDFNCYFI